MRFLRILIFVIPFLGLACLRLADTGNLSSACDEFVNPTYRVITLEDNHYKISAVGAGQGIQIIEGNTYLYGDSDTGVVVELKGESPNPTGWMGRLTDQGVDLIGHPTGIAYREGYPTFIVQVGGSMFQIDWPTFRAEGVLDNAILNIIDTQGQQTRPEYVLLGGEWLIATTGYDAGEDGNIIFILDPWALTKAESLDDPGVILYKIPGPSLVQDLHWDSELERLVLVQNLEIYKGWRLTRINLETAIDEESALDSAIEQTICFIAFEEIQPYTGIELEGYAVVPESGEEFFLTAPPDENSNFFIIQSRIL